MKKTISICFFTIVLFFVVYVTGLCLLWGRNRQPAKEQDGQQMAEESGEEEMEYMESMSLQTPILYRLMEQDGRLVVANDSGDEIFFETNIRVKDMDAEFQQRLKAGITFSTEQELYDFLESYSS